MQSQFSKIHGRDYINVHDIPGAISKTNVGVQIKLYQFYQYTGKRRFDENQRSASFGRGEIQQSPLIGMPKLRHVDPMKQHQRDRSQVVQPYNQLVPQQNSYQATPQQMQRKEYEYQDELDKFMRQADMQKKQVPQMQELITPRGERSSLLSDLEQRPLLTQRNNPVAKSTANLIINSQVDDQSQMYSSVKQPRKSILNDLEDSKQAPTKQSLSGTNSPTNGGSPYQVQKKINHIQQSLNAQLNQESSQSYLEKISQNKESQRYNKNQKVFNINSSTLPENGRYSVKEQEGTIKRGLQFAPSTYLGQHHKEEIDQSIQKREYTKLGGANLPIQMPSDLNNINYHRSNPMKDYTYNNLTGAYYYKAQQ